mmetsp:Transcript_21522/g.30388  ORF Transcript_21522/g.30388 Transcript_21522/m.30388 type:complete len:112 (+) Transcript_21522:250-585(+)
MKSKAVLFKTCNPCAARRHRNYFKRTAAAKAKQVKLNARAPGSPHKLPRLSERGRRPSATSSLTAPAIDLLSNYSVSSPPPVPLQLFPSRLAFSLSNLSDYCTDELEGGLL